MRIVLFHFISQITQFFKTTFEKLREFMENKGLFIINPRGNKTNLTLKNILIVITFILFVR
jgi:hypothetical protein